MATPPTQLPNPKERTTEFYTGLPLDKDRVVLEGKVIRIRKLSKWIQFVDLLVQGTEENIMELVLKQTSLANFETVQSQVQLGDTVVVKGYYENRQPNCNLIHVQQLELKLKRTWYEPKVTDTDKSLKKELNYSYEITQLHWEAEGKKDKLEGICKFYVNSGRCSKGDHCAYQHPTENLKLLRKEYVQKKRQKQLQASQDLHSTFPPLHKDKLRHRIFATFIKQTYFNLATPNILEVAGGSGNLSLELFYNQNFPKVTVVDPRPVKLDKRWLRHFKLHKMDPNRENLGPIRISSYFKLAEFPKYLDQDGGSPYNLILGLHPDQPTLDILKFAIRTNCRFAVIPCCIFLNEDKPNQSVQDYEGYLLYLKQLVTQSNYIYKVKLDRLPFVGRNKVLFSDGELK